MNQQKAILAVNLNPGYQRTLVVPKLVPGEVNRCRKSSLHISGKGINGVRIITQAGGEAKLLSQIGRTGLKEFKEAANKENIDLIPVPADDPRGVPGFIRTCTTVIDEQSRLSTELVEPGYAVSALNESVLIDRFRQHCPDQGILILTGSKAPGFSETLFPDFCYLASAKGNDIILDIRGPDLVNSLQKIDTKTNKNIIVNINIAEFMSTFTGQSVFEQQPLNELLPKLRSLSSKIETEYPQTTFILSHGREGVVIFSSPGVEGFDYWQQILPPPVDHVQNTIGCGDALTAGIAHGLSCGLTIKNAVETGLNYAGRNAAVTTPGSLIDIPSL